tara:strand:- start:887 stop:1027 length:141 start_codon:yes stop_codon:yes gene_type:complete
MRITLLERIKKYNKIIAEILENKIDKCVEESLKRQSDRMTNNDKRK